MEQNKTTSAISATNDQVHIASFACSLKLLVSNNTAGSVIGKSGQTIAEIQAITQCRIKLSQANDYFPGTSERVCLLQGSPTSIKLAVAHVLNKFRDGTTQSGDIVMVDEDEIRAAEISSHNNTHPEANSCDPTQSQSQPQPSVEEPTSPNSPTTPTPRAGYLLNGMALHDVPLPPPPYMVRVLVPSLACGMIIGRAGANIKSMSEQTGTKIQLAQKDEMASIATNERIVTVNGDLGEFKFKFEFVLRCGII